MAEIVRFFFGVLVLFAALGGYGAFLRRKFAVLPEAVPILSLAAVMLLTFLFGIVGLLLPGAMVTVAVGIVLLIDHIRRARHGNFTFRPLLSAGAVFVLIGFVLLIPRLWTVTYTHYDNFSHWGVVLREMLTFHAFPNADTIVLFNKYPTGTASFLYLFCTLTGYSEGIALIGQALIVLASLAPLFIGASRHRGLVLGSVTVALVFLSFMRYDNGTLHAYNLLTDTVHAALCGASLLLAHHSLRDRRALAVSVCPLLVWIMLIKANGAALLLIAVVLIARMLRHDRMRLCNPPSLRRTDARIMILLVSAPIAAYALYLLYAAFAFSFDLRGFLSENALLANLADVMPLALWGVLALALVCGVVWLIRFAFLRGKGTLCVAILFAVGTFAAWLYMSLSRSPSFYPQFLACFFREITDITSINTQMYLLLNAILAFPLLLPISPLCRARIRRTLAGANIGMLLYLGFLFVFFSVGMAEHEAVRCAAYDRYMGTSVLVFAELVLFTLVRLPETEDKRAVAMRIVPPVLALALCLPGVVQLVTGPNYVTSERHLLEETTSRAAPHIPRDGTVVLYNGDRGRADLYVHLSAYAFATRNCTVLEKGGDAAILEDFAYLVVAVEDSILPAMLREAGIEGDLVTGAVVYAITTTENTTRIEAIE